MVTTTTGIATEYINFSRASLATVTDADGKIKWAPHNLLSASEQFDASAWLKTNTTSTTPTITANDAAAPNSTTTADKAAFGTIDAAGDLSAVYQTFTAVAATYTGGVYVKAAAAGDVGKKVWMFMYDSAYRGVASVTLTADWQLLTTSATLTAGSGREFYIATIGSANGGENQGAVSVLLWGAHLYRSDLGGMQANTSAYPLYNPTTAKNLLGFSEDFSNAAWTKTNILAFGSGSIVNTVANPVNSLTTADLIVPNTTSGTHTVDQVIYTAVNGSAYMSSVYVKAAGYSKVALFDNAAGSRWVSFNLSGAGSVIANGASATGAITALSDGWYRISMAENAGTSALAFTIFVLSDAYVSGSPSAHSFSGNGTSGIYLWGAQLSDSASLDPYVASPFAAPTAGAYHGPRRDFDPAVVGSCKGLLVEEQRSNLLLRSSAFDNASWLKSGLAATPVVADTVISPDGTLSADKIVESNTTAQHYVYQSATTTAVAHTFSVYAKAAERSFIYLQCDSPVVAQYFNLSTGALGNSVGSPTSSITSVGNGWYRCTMTFTANAATPAFYIMIASANGTTSYAGDGASGVYLYGAQVESGAFPTSLIPTGASSVTRSADVASVATSAFPYSSTEGTVVVNYARIGINRYSRLFNLGDASENNQVSLLNFNVGQENAYFVTGGAAAAVVTGPSTPAVNAISKMGLAFKSGDSAISLNGASATAISSTFTPAATALYLGGTPVSGQYLNGHIRQVTYLPRRISNSELQSRSV